MKQLFCTELWQFDLLSKVTESQLDQLCQVVLENLQDQNVRRSNFGKSKRTTDNFLSTGLHENDVGLEVMKCYRQAVLEYGYKPERLSFVYWGIATYKNGYNIRHCHPDSLLSGVLYLSAPPGSGCLRLSDPRPAKRFETTKYRNTDKPQGDYIIEPKKGSLIIFPSWLEHEVEPSFEIEAPRVIMSFNAKPA